MLVHAVLGVIPPPGRIASGELWIRVGDGPAPVVDLARLDPLSEAMRAVRGRHLGMVFQNALASLTPTLTIGSQLTELIRLYRPSETDEIAVDTLVRVGIPDPRRIFAAYPYQLSGGLAQRAMIALAICCRPRVLFADEPTTALDPIRRDEVLELIAELQRELGMAVLHIGHDVSTVAAFADRLAVMYAGRVVETGLAAAVVAPRSIRIRAGCSRRSHVSGGPRMRSCRFQESCRATALAGGAGHLPSGATTRSRGRATSRLPRWWSPATTERFAAFSRARRRSRCEPAAVLADRRPAKGVSGARRRRG